MLRLGTVVLGADDVGRAVSFWSSVLGYDVVEFADSDDEFTILVPPDRIGTRIALHHSLTPTQERPRLTDTSAIETTLRPATDRRVDDASPEAVIPALRVRLAGQPESQAGTSGTLSLHPRLPRASARPDCRRTPAG